MSTRVLLSGAMFLSGAAALLYETLFFRLAALALGSSTIAAAVVLAAFRGGLAAGKFLAGKVGETLRDPLRAYQRIEWTIALSGAGMVLLLPPLQGALAPLFAGIAARQPALDLARSAVALLLLGIPATAMGATLPVLAQSASGRQVRFGAVFGGMYAWNTLGAVCGALAGEPALIPWLGLTGTAMAAAGLNCASAALAGLAAAGAGSVAFGRDTRCGDRADGQGGRAWPIIAAGALSGFCFLALEVVWFRLLQLFVFSSSLNFAAMLAVALAGIGIGALVASAALGRGEGGATHAVALLCACGAAGVLGYRLFLQAVPRAAPLSDHGFLLALAGALMLPLSLASGALFPLLGQLLHRVTGGAARPAGWLTTANTAGAGLGALAAAFVLLPRFGMERSLLLLTLVYGAAACLLAVPACRGLAGPSARSGAVWSAASALIFTALLLTFPAGAVGGLLDRSVENFVRYSGERRVLQLETPRETVQYLRKDLLGEPHYHRLVTNSFSMSTTTLWARRYMRLFAAIPLALRPDAEDALLICYGCGTTARALTASPQLRRIDIVDISREIVGLGSVVFPDARRNPVHDPRVTVNIEDGRFFLRTTARSYDVITGEPPPPKAGHVVDLYSREYFGLVASRLKEGGVASYWLPVHQLAAGDAKAIVRAFCDAFAACSLWLGDGGNWIMAGVRGSGRPPTDEGLSRQWADPDAGSDLREVGVSSPAQLAALYIAGGARLRDWVGDAAPLTDDRPGRLSLTRGSTAADREEFDRVQDPRASWGDFAGAGGMAGLWPERLRREALPWFRLRGGIDRAMLFDARALAACLDDPGLGEQLLWVFGSDAVAQRILDAAALRGWREEQAGGEVLPHLAARAARRGEFGKAAALLDRALGDPLFRENLEVLRQWGEMRRVLAGRAGTELPGLRP